MSLQGEFFAGAFAEGVAFDDFEDEAGDARVVASGFFDDGVDGAGVGGVEAAAEAVDQQFFGEAAGELLGFLVTEQGFELLDALEGAAAGEGAGGVDGGVAVVRAPGADGVEVFEAEAERVELGVTAGAAGVGAVLFEALAECALEGAFGLVVFEGGNVGGRGRRRGAEDLFEDVFAAFDGGSAAGVGGEGEDAGLSEQAAAWT